MLWRELALRAHRRNFAIAGLPGDALERVTVGIAEDVETFESIMRKLGAKTDAVKTGLAVVAERLGRVKLNGRVRSYSPLSRFEELEFLAMGIEGKKQLWTTLRDLASVGSRPGVDFDDLISRAEAQRAELERFRVSAGSDGFNPDLS